MVESNKDQYKNLKDRQQLDVFGTPMPIKSPINFERHLDKQKESNKAAMKKLTIVAFVSVFFITA